MAAEVGVVLSAAQLAVVSEALGDAYAYRTNSGETTGDDLEDYEREAAERYLELSRQLRESSGSLWIIPNW